MLTVDHTGVDAAPRPVERDVEGALEVDRDAEVGGEQVGGPRGDDRDRHTATRHRVDHTLHGAVAAPDDDEVGARRGAAPRLLGGPAALVNLAPHVDRADLALETTAERGEAVTEGLS